MKFFLIVLLGCLAFTAASDSIEAGNTNVNADGKINFFLKPFKFIYETTKNLLSKSYIKISEIVQKSLSSLSSITKKLEKDIDEVAKKNSKSKDCVEQYKQELNSTETKIENDLKSCAKEFVSQIQNREKLVLEDYSKIEKKVEEFRLASVTCIHFSPITTTKCIYNKTAEYKKIIVEIGSTFKKTVEDATIKAAKIPQKLLSCNNKVVKEGVAKLDEISKNVKKCAEEPTPEQPTTEQPKTEQPKTEQPKTELPN